MIPSPTNRSKAAWLILILIMLAAGWWAWNRDLAADPPPNFSGISQSLSTDPALYTYHARNRVLFGQADPLGDSRWILFEKSFAGLLATIWFRVSSPDIEHGRQVGIFLSFAALIFFLVGLWKHHRPWVTVAVALLYLTNCTLFVYGRYPFLEISLMFFAGLVFLMYACWGDRWWGLCLAICGVALATFTGKLFGVLLLPTLMLADWISSAKETRLRRLGMMAGVFVAVSAILVVLLFGSHTSDAFGFLREQTVGYRGLPTGLSSPWAFVESVIGFGFLSGLYVVSPELLVMLMAALGLVFIGRSNRPNLLSGLPRTTLLALFWVFLTWLAMAPQTICPTRYLLTLIPAIAILFFSLADVIQGRGEAWNVRFSWLSAVGAGVFCWVVAAQVCIRLWLTDDPNTDYIVGVWYTLPVGVAAVFIARYPVNRLDWHLRRSFVSGIVVVALIGTVGSTIYSATKSKLAESQYSIATANTDLGYLLGPGAVISGPYAAALTQQNQLLSHPHFFGETWSDSALFVTLPITHLAVDGSNFARARKQSRSLESARPVTGYWIGSHEITIFDISQVYDNPAANKYPHSTYERAAIYYDANQFDSTMILLAASPDLINNSRSAALLYARAMYRVDLDSDAVHNYMVLHRLYPTDFLITLEAANVLHQIGEVRNDSLLVGTARGLYRDAADLNPHEGQRVLELYNQTAEYFKTQRTRRPQNK
ncbi:MAG: hypothetical protein HY851_00870 [candidate division Zixibacteria bacterium]|nr:hypothetical protein [candidate division Zixibacteria bacterium]